MRADELMVDPVLAAKGPSPQASSFVGARWFRSDAATAAIGGAASSGDHGRLLRVMAGCMGYETDRLSFSSKPGGIQLFPEGEGASAAVAAGSTPRNVVPSSGSRRDWRGDGAWRCAVFPTETLEHGLRQDLDPGACPT